MLEVSISGPLRLAKADFPLRQRWRIRHRRELTDGQWRRIEPLIPGKDGDKGRHGEDNRLFIDAVLWLARAGAPWRVHRPAPGARKAAQRFLTQDSLAKSRDM